MDKGMTKDLLAFIGRCPSNFHTAAAVRRELEGYEILQEGEVWNLRPGGRYCLTRNGASLIAFRVPAGEWQGFLLAAGHSDSPTFQIKTGGEVQGPENYLRLNTERYGGMLCDSWLDRPLSAAGRLLVRTDRGVESRLVEIDRDLLLIPRVAIHMNRRANEGMAYDPKQDLLPLLGLAGGPSLLSLAAECAGVREEDVAASELSLYVREPGTIWGAAGEFVSAPRLDDLQCVYAALRGFLSASEGRGLPVLCVFDSEEVGSATRQGADGTLLRDVLGRICAALGRELPVEIHHSFLVSADNAHAVHPNHPELADPQNRPRLNGGVVIKHSASRRYTTDAVSEAVFAELCRRAGVPVQHFANRSDMAGGSTLGNIVGSHVSLNTVDVGLGQLAMHSAYETAGALDTAYMAEALRTFYSAGLTVRGDGEIEIH